MTGPAMHMGAPQDHVEIVRVRREQGPADWFYATSSTINGLFVCQPTLDALDQAIPQAIAELYLAVGRKVVVSPAYEDGQRLQAWAVIPSDIIALADAAD